MSKPYHKQQEPTRAQSKIVLLGIKTRNYFNLKPRKGPKNESFGPKNNNFKSSANAWGPIVCNVEQ